MFTFGADSSGPTVRTKFAEGIHSFLGAGFFSSRRARKRGGKTALSQRVQQGFFSAGRSTSACRGQNGFPLRVERFLNSCARSARRRFGACSGRETRSFPEICSSCRCAARERNFSWIERLLRQTRITDESFRWNTTLPGPRKLRAAREKSGCSRPLEFSDSSASSCR